jgi:hypothetical protein
MSIRCGFDDDEKTSRRARTFLSQARSAAFRAKNARVRVCSTTSFWCALMETTLLFRFYCMRRTRQFDTFECHYDVKINFMINVRHVERNDRAARALRCATTADKRDARTSLFALYNDTTDTHATHTFKLRIRNAICDAHDARRTRLG